MSTMLDEQHEGGRTKDAPTTEAHASIPTAAVSPHTSAKKMLFNAGEEEMQRKAGTFDFAHTLGEHKIKDYIAPEFREFVEDRHAVFVASTDPDTGAVWCSSIFADSTDEIPCECRSTKPSATHELPESLRHHSNKEIMSSFAAPGTPFCKPLDTCSVAVATSTLISQFQSSAYRPLVKLTSPSVIVVTKAPGEGDPLWKNGVAGAPISLSFLEFETRRRFRANGILRDKISNQGFTLDLKESFSICPKYIQRRTIEAIHSPPSKPQVLYSDSSDASLPENLIEFILKADTFMIATMSSDTGCDASHRGGRPGFIRIADKRKLLWGDYVGKGLFQTLGNTLLHPQAGLMFIDFENGPILQLSGKIQIEWPGPGLSLDNSDRLVIFTIDTWRYYDSGCPFKYRFIDMSSHHPILEDKPILRKWYKQSLISAVQEYKGLEDQEIQSAIIEEIRPESFNVKTIRFKLPINLSHQPGQYATFSVDLDNSRYMRSFTISSANLMTLEGRPEESNPSPEENSSPYFEISVRINPGGPCSNWLHSTARKGDRMYLMGVEGSFTLDSSFRVFVSQQGESAEKLQKPFNSWWKVLYLTAGIGLTPAISMVRGLEHSKEKGYIPADESPDIVWIHSERSFDGFAFNDTITELMNSGLCERFCLTLSHQEQPDGETRWQQKTKNSSLHYGHVDHNVFDAQVPQLLDRVVYLCGPNTFMGAMVEYLTHMGVSPRHILTESFDY